MDERKIIMGIVIIRSITEEEYQELKKAQYTLNKILSRWDNINSTEKYDNDSRVLYSPIKGENIDIKPDIDILNKYPIEVNSFSTIFQIDMYLITKKVRNIWNELTQEEKNKAILNAEKYKKYENKRLKEPNLLYYLQDKKFNWKQFN